MKITMSLCITCVFLSLEHIGWAGTHFLLSQGDDAVETQFQVHSVEQSPKIMCK